MADDRFVLALTRTCGSGATIIGKMLAEEYGIGFYDKKILRMASDDSGISEELFAKADETMKKSLLYNVTKKVYNGEIIPPESPDYTKNDNLFAFQAKVLKELAERESFVWCRDVDRTKRAGLDERARILRCSLITQPVCPRKAEREHGCILQKRRKRMRDVATK